MKELAQGYTAPGVTESGWHTSHRILGLKILLFSGHFLVSSITKFEILGKSVNLFVSHH